MIRYFLTKVQRYSMGKGLSFYQWHWGNWESTWKRILKRQEEDWHCFWYDENKEGELIIWMPLFLFCSVCLCAVPWKSWQSIGRKVAYISLVERYTENFTELLHSSIPSDFASDFYKFLINPGHSFPFNLPTWAK